MRYDLAYSTAIKRALETADVSLRSFIERSTAAGMGAKAVADRLIEDLETGGPVFGPFLRSLEGAARGSVVSAYRQGSIAGQIKARTAGRAALKRARALRRVEDPLAPQPTRGPKARDFVPDIDRAIEDADPEELEAIERSADSVPHRWVATMVNTCHRCLPLHGHVNTLAGWRESGFHPDTIHDGWASDCQCSLVAEDEDEGRAATLAPLLRTKIRDPKTGKSLGRTVRAVTQADITKALAARDAAMQSVEGRRTLRLIGESQGEQ